MKKDSGGAASGGSADDDDGSGDDDDRVRGYTADVSGAKWVAEEQIPWLAAASQLDLTSVRLAVLFAFR